MWGKVLAEVKKYNERKIPDIDMSAVHKTLDKVCGLVTADQVNSQKSDVRDLVDLLRQFGSVDDHFNHSQGEEKARFLEKISALSHWSQERFQPGIQDMNRVLVDWISAATPAEAPSMAESARSFKPLEIKVPAEVDGIFHLQCPFAASTVR